LLLFEKRFLLVRPDGILPEKASATLGKARISAIIEASRTDFKPPAGETPEKRARGLVAPTARAGENSRASAQFGRKCSSLPWCCSLSATLTKNDLSSPDGQQWRARSSAHRFLHERVILASSAAVNPFSAKATGHMAPSSRFALSLKPNVA